MTPYQPRIAIVGSGPAGLTLGRLLFKAGVQVTIFERRPAPTDQDFDKPCGMLDLHEESGLEAVRRCGLWDRLVAVMGDCTEETKVYDHGGNLLHHDVGLGGRPEVSRHALVKLLMEDLPSGTIKWERKVVGVAASTAEDGRTEMVVDFGAAHDKQAFDFVVGADGAWSKVRGLLTPVTPSYSGMHMITLDLLAVAAEHPALSEFLGRGSMMSLAFGNGIMSQRGPNGTARFYLAVRTPDENFFKNSGLADKTAREAASALVEDAGLFGKWTAPLCKEAVVAACQSEQPGDKLDIKPLYVLPIEHAWETQVGLTIVGDAAHLMTPFTGGGVNQAMFDGFELADVITEAVRATGDGDARDFQRNMLPLLEAFEKNMISRARREKAETVASQERMFGGDNGSVEFAAWFKSIFDTQDEAAEK